MAGGLALVEKVYKSLREFEKDQGPGPLIVDVSRVFEIAVVREFLDMDFSGAPELHAEKKLQEAIYHIKDGMKLEQMEFLLVPFERYLQKNLKDDDFIVLAADSDVRFERFPVVIVLENLRSSFNVGSFFRLADGLGVSELHLCGYTPLPSKTGMGSEEVVTYRQHPKSLECLQTLRDQGYRIIAVETTTKSSSYSDTYVHEPTCFVFGNERFGINHETLRSCDEIRHIEMFGKKNSFNVAVCGGIFVAEWVRQWRK